MLNRKFSASQGSFDRGFLSGLATGVFVSSLLFFFIAALAIVLLPSTASSAQESDQQLASESLRPIGDIRRDMEAFAKRTKNKDDQDEQVAGAIDLCILHHEIVNDPRFQTNDRLKSFRAIAATRLKNVKKEVELALKRQARAEKKSNRIKHAPSSNAQDRDATTDLDGDEMAFAAYHEIVANEFESMSQFTGGPIRLWSYAGGPQCDYGEDLVNLITSTIDPDFWRSNGGDGIIEYYQPLRIIVVSGTAKVQDEATDLLRRLRYLSR